MRPQELTQTQYSNDVAVFHDDFVTVATPCAVAGCLAQPRENSSSSPFPRHWRPSNRRLSIVVGLVHEQYLIIHEPWRLHFDRCTLAVINLSLASYLNFFFFFFFALIPLSITIDSTSPLSWALKHWSLWYHLLGIENPTNDLNTPWDRKSQAHKMRKITNTRRHKF